MVNIEINGEMTYINCNCELGVEKKICRHKINAIRGDKENRHSSTSDETIKIIKRIFGAGSTLRQHLEEKWRMLRIFASENRDDESEISNKRRILGEAFANGFINKNENMQYEDFDADEWEESRQTYADGLNCPVILNYVSYEGEATNRNVLVEEVFISGSKFYILGYCNLRNEKRTFRVDRIQSLDFGQECSKSEKSFLINVIFQGTPAALT